MAVSASPLLRGSWPAVGFRKAGKRSVDQILHWNGKKWFAADNTIARLNGVHSRTAG